MTSGVRADEMSEYRDAKNRLRPNADIRLVDAGSKNRSLLSTLKRRVADPKAVIGSPRDRVHVGSDFPTCGVIKVYCWFWRPKFRQHCGTRFGEASDG